METMTRKPFQGVFNILRFNWHFYVLALALLTLLFVLQFFASYSVSSFLFIFILLIAFASMSSLLVSFYVYDCSNLYCLNWLDFLNIHSNSKLVTVNAGFDETSFLLHQKFPDSTLSVFDFYDASKHTEVSIARARKTQEVYPGTEIINTSLIPLKDNYVDFAFAIFSVHEIRNTEERILFFRQLRRILNTNGKIVVVEHLRDLPNFIAYNFGLY